MKITIRKHTHSTQGQKPYLYGVYIGKTCIVEYEAFSKEEIEAEIIKMIVKGPNNE